MTRFSMTAGIAAALALTVTAPAQAALSIGAKAPDFTTRGAKAGKVFKLRLSDWVKKGPIVLYFFPKAFTSGCTKEAHEFAERSADFQKLGATVIGMSNDDVETLARFSKEECRDKFAVASAGPDIVKAYDVALAPMISSTSNRTSYVIAPSGRITFVHSEMDYKGHVSSTLAAVKQISRKK